MFDYIYSFHLDKTWVYITFGIRAGKKENKKKSSEIVLTIPKLLLNGCPSINLFVRLWTTDREAIETNLQSCLEWEIWDIDVKHQQIESNFS